MANIYLAGPFFNREQHDHAVSMAEMVRKAGHVPIAPVEQGFEKVSSVEDAKRIFTKNVQDLHHADIMLAQLDYLLPQGKELRIVTKGGVVSGPLSIPDSGTVWEMGMAYALGLRKVGYIVSDVPKINVMLAQSCDGFLRGYAQISEFLNNGLVLPEDGHGWKGGLI